MKVAVREPGRMPQDGWVDCRLNQDIRFSTVALESYAFSKWEPVISDAMLVAASVEHADVSCLRPTLGWARHLSIRIPVDDPARWEAPPVIDGLHSAIAGIRHMDDLADMANGRAGRIVRRHATSLERVLPPTGSANDRLVGLLERHADEWRTYLRSLGAGSFVKKWVRGDR